MTFLISRNGNLLSETEATIGVTGAAFQNAKAVYTSLRTYEGSLFKLDQHLERLSGSADQLGFKLSASLDQIREWVEDILQQSSFDPAFLRITATPKDLYIQSRELIIDPEIYKGVKAITHPLAREMVKAKVVGTPGTLAAYQKAQDAGAYEALLVNPRAQLITEGSRSNVLWIKDGILHWCDDALSGITQATVLELAQKAGIAVKKSELPVADLASVEELFVTQTSRGIVPVIQVDETTIGTGTVGSVTQMLMRSFDQLTSGS